jgi:L-Lysine epsilon oxidase N-terminal/L-lysine epsilon oxidase C-terminal domain
VWRRLLRCEQTDLGTPRDGSVPPQGVAKEEFRLSRSGLLKLFAGAVGALFFGSKQTGLALAAGDRASGQLRDTRIVRCAIHPGIGIARVGNSPTEYFVGPEVPGIAPDPGGSYKDAQGRIKRQVARFHVYGLNASGQVVKELTANDAHITWTVRLANKKAAWYQFQLPLDIPEASSATLPPGMQSTRRNAAVRGRARQGLVIDPGPRSIKGKNAQGRAYRFDTGTFLGRRISLGELRTGVRGNLLVFGGLGKAGTTAQNNPPKGIANNDGWYDDISDGPVTAQVVLQGKKLPVAPAWVIVAPPSYAPGITSVVTLYDVAHQAYVDAHPQPEEPIFFTRDIYPILKRFDDLQWVNEGFFLGYGWQGEVALLDPGLLTQLASNDASTAGIRQQIFSRFRDPSYPAIQEDAWPRLYGDDFAQPPQSPRQYLAVTREQYRRLGEWAQGTFIADWDPASSVPQTLAELPLHDQPGALDRAALDACLGGPFHPGEEATWNMRQPSLYAGLCRLRMRHSGDSPEPNYGDILTPARALGPDGPLHRSGPGDITRWMAVPWQTDAANCGSAYPNSTQLPPKFPDLPTFWPAVIPNNILTEQAYQRVLDTGLGVTVRQDAFRQRVPWIRHLSSDYQARNKQSIKAWSLLGIIRRKVGPGDPAFPARMYVETEGGFPETSEKAAATPEDQSVSTYLTDRQSHL